MPGRKSTSLPRLANCKSIVVAAPTVVRSPAYRSATRLNQRDDGFGSEIAHRLGALLFKILIQHRNGTQSDDLLLEPRLLGEQLSAGQRFPGTPAPSAVPRRIRESADAAH